MKFRQKTQFGFAIILNLINCSSILVFLFLCVNGIKINYYNGIIALTVLFILNMVLFGIIISFKGLISSMKDKIEMFEVICEACPNAILIHSRLKVIYANNKAGELFNLKDSSEIIGNSLEKFITLNKEVIGDERLNNALEGKYFEPLVEEMFIREDGEVVELEVFSTPVEIKGEISVLNICKNITEKKRILELERKIELEEKRLREKADYDKLKDEFFANLSHEIRTPLAIILGTVQLVEKNTEMQELNQGKNYEILKQNCYRILRLVNNLVDITKIDSGYFSINKDNYNIVALVEDTVLSVAEYVKNKGLYIEFDTNEEDILIECDPDSIERILLNLISNSIKFTSKGGNIFVNVIKEDDNVKISIRDTGIGIKEEYINLVFDRFRQVDKSFTRKHEGSGLGLSIVKSLVEKNDGEISLHSEYGKGSEFTIVFPVKKSIGKKDVDKVSRRDILFGGAMNIEFSDI